MNMRNDDKTEPRMIAVQLDNYQEDGSPGCLIWAIVGVFGILLAAGIVVTAALAGFNSGLEASRATATTERRANIATQCAILPDDILAGRSELVALRLQDITANGSSIPACAEPLIPMVTQMYLQSLVTPTATPSPSPTATELPILQATSTPEATLNASGFDLAALLTEAQQALSAGDHLEAIRTLDAIIAIDAEYERQVVNNLLFNALTTRATLLYRTDGGSLPEAIMLSNRAEEYGDIGDLAFERTIAQYYLDAQPYMNVNFTEAIRLLSLVRNFSPNYRGVTDLIYGQYIAYGDALVLGMEPCRAVEQYNAALTFYNNQQVVSKRDDAQIQCDLAAAATPDPNATVDPNAAPTIAPIGQPGG
jgi:hypothetical protein